NPHSTFCARQKGLDAVRTDLFSGLRGRFDLILFNPPYLPTQPDERIDDWLEHALDGGATGRMVIERCAASVGDMLAPGGRILLLVSSLTGLSEVREIFAGRGFLAEVVLQQDVEDEELFVLRITKRETLLFSQRMSTTTFIAGMRPIIASPGRNQLLSKSRYAAQSSPVQESRKKKTNWRRLYMDSFTVCRAG